MYNLIVEASDSPAVAAPSTLSPTQSQPTPIDHPSSALHHNFAQTTPLTAGMQRKGKRTADAAELCTSLSTSSTTLSGRRDCLSLDLRTKKMKPTDCLLFAASLMDDANNNDKETVASRNGNDLATTALTAGTSKAKGYRNDNSIMIPTNSKPRDLDVLCGRGGLVNNHPGNVVYRRVVDHNKALYLSVHKRHRILVSQSIVQSVLNNGGRFMTLDMCHGNRGGNSSRDTSQSSYGAATATTAAAAAAQSSSLPSAYELDWITIDFKKAVQKTSQALRERGHSGKGRDKHGSKDVERDKRKDNARYDSKIGRHCPGEVPTKEVHP